MINQLVEFGESIINENSHNALKEEFVSIQITIDGDGTFLGITNFQKRKINVESIQRTSGKKARFLVDKCDYVFGFNEENIQTKEQHTLFIDKLTEARSVKELKPVISFYTENAQNGIQKVSFEIFSKLKDTTGNIAFCVIGKDCFVAEEKSILIYIKHSYDSKKLQTVKNDKKCAICGKQNFPIPEIHDKIKGVPQGQSSGTALISFNASSFESYGLKRNYNASVCEQCAKNYVNGLNFLLSEGIKKTAKNGKKEYTDYFHRKNLSSNSCLLFWVKNKPGETPKEITAIENPKDSEDFLHELFAQTASNFQQMTKTEKVDPSQFKRITDAPFSAVENFKAVHDDLFYSMVISGESARIAVRSWTETNSSLLKQHVAAYFSDIKIYSSFEEKFIYPPINTLIKSCTKDSDDAFAQTAGSALWNAALAGYGLPLSILHKVIQRIQLEGIVTSQRASFMKIILNRHSKGGYEMKERLDCENTSRAYTAGRIFAVLEKIQYSAVGEVNTGIRDRFFSSASTTPATAFGRLMKMSQNHLSKLSKENPGQAVNLDKLLTEIFSKIDLVPALFNLEEQGQFAIGYYHQRQELFSKKDETNTKEEEK